MKQLLVLLFVSSLGAQTPPAAPAKKAASNAPSPEAGDDVRGYNDTPRLPNQKWRVHDMERPRPVKVTPAPYVNQTPPADATILFDGTGLGQWTGQGRGGVAQQPTWKVENGYIEIVPRTGRLVTKESFGDCQLHIEWQIPKNAVGNGQGIGNSGVELMSRYEVQVLESSEHQTYADGGAGAIYGVWAPLANPSRPMGEWNVYDIFFEGPRFDGGKLVKPAYMTVLFNGVLVQNHKEFLGTTVWRRLGTYVAHPPELPLSLQDHSQPVRFRNIWIRKFDSSNDR
jgi:hypothetical protein